MTADARRQLAEALDWHLTDRDAADGCALRCGYDGDDRAEHLADALAPVVTRTVAAELRDLADLIDRGPAVPPRPSVFSALARERADGIDRDGDPR